jgi:raffinose/stachyose/melibiose transport system substrate-binding protein
MFCATQDALYYNIENKAPTALDTGIAIEGMSDLAQRNYDQFSNAKIKVASLWAATFSTAMSAEIATLNSKLLTGGYAPDDYIRDVTPIWADNFN